MYKIVDNFLTGKELAGISRERGFNPFGYSIHKVPLTGFKAKLFEEASKFVDLSTTIQAEVWYHNPVFSPLPKKHYDKDEALHRATGELSFPLVSCILYLKIGALVGSDLLIEEDVITPKPNRLVLMKPGVEHEVTPWISGTRVSVNMNLWDKKLHKQAENHD